MAGDRTTIGLTAEARKVGESLEERLQFKDLAHVRDLAVAHAISAGIEPVDVPGVTTIWSVANASDDLIKVIQILYPVHAEKGIYTLYQNLTNLGLLDLGCDKNFDLWSEISDLPGLSG